MPRTKTPKDIAVDRVRDLIEFFKTQASASVQHAYMRAAGPHPFDVNPMDDAINALRARARQSFRLLDDSTANPATVAYEMSNLLAYIALLPDHSRYQRDADGHADVGDDADGHADVADADGHADVADDEDGHADVADDADGKGGLE